MSRLSLWLVPLAAASLLWACGGGGGGDDDPADARASTDGQVSPDGGAADAAPDRDTGGADAAPDRDSGGADAAADAGRGDAVVAPDSSALPPSPAAAPPPLFGPDTPGAGAFDPPLAELIDAWYAVPSDEPSAQANTIARRDAIEAIRRGGGPAAERITDVCADVPVHAVGPTLLCLRLLSLVDSPRSLELLASRAQAAIPAWPQGAHPVDPSPQALARRVALKSLATRAREGSSTAIDLLVRSVAAIEGPGRALAVAAVYEAMPRHLAKKRLRAVLPEAELYRLYESR